MSSSQMETLFLEKCGFYANQNSVSADPLTARVVLVSTLDNYLRQTYPSAYQKIMEHCKSLELFLKNQGREIIRTGAIKLWQDWNYEIMSTQNYIQDKRHAHHCFSELTIPRHQLDENKSLFIFYSRDEKRRYEAERASLNRKQRMEQERVEREAREQNVIRISQPMHTDTSPRRLDSLTEEIMNLCGALTPTKKSIDDIKHLKKRIQIMLNQVWPEMKYQVAIFGSSANSLALHNADVDFCIVVPEAKHEEDLRHYRNRLSKQPRSIYNMFFLAARLREMGMRNVEAIGHASVPICKFIDSHTGLECDINTHNILGIENTKMIQTYCEMDARIRPLVFAVKQFVKQKKINNPRGGTLSSYAYVIMMLHFLMAGLADPLIPSLQTLESRCLARNCNYKYSKPVSLFHDHQFIKCDARYHDCVYIRNLNTPAYDMANRDASTMWEGRNSDPISVLLRKFFEYYSNPHNFFISIITNDGAIYHPNEISTNNRCNLIVQDPFILSKNVARSCTATGFDIILYEFQRASRLLTEGGHRFSEICDSTSNIPRAVDTDSMEYRFQQKQQQQQIAIKKSTTTQQQRQSYGKQEIRFRQEDIVVGYISDDSPKRAEKDIYNFMGCNSVVNDEEVYTREKEPIESFSRNSVEESDDDEYTAHNTKIKWIAPSPEQQENAKLEPKAKANGNESTHLLTRYISVVDQPEKGNTYQEATSASVRPPTAPPETTNIAPILNLVETLMKLQPQAENCRTFESYTSKPCTDMSKLLEDPAITTVRPKDIVYLIAQLNFLGDAVADKILSNSLTGVVKPVSPAEVANNINNNSSSSTTFVEPFTDTEAGLLYVKQLQDMMNSVELSGDDEEYEETEYEDDDDEAGSILLDLNGDASESETDYHEDEEVHIEYFVQNAPEQIEGYEMYNMLQWYGRISEIKFINNGVPCWKLDMVLPYKNIKLLPAILDFGDFMAKGFATFIG